MDRYGDREAGLEGVAGALEELPDAAGEVALEAAQGFAAGLAVGLLASEVGGGVGVQAALGDGEAVQRAVELAVAAAVEAVAVGAPGGRGDRRGAGQSCELGVGREAFVPAISPISFAAVSTPQPGSASSWGARSATDGEFALERAIDRVSSRMRRSSSRAIRTRAVCRRAQGGRRCGPANSRGQTRAGISSSGQRS